MLKDIIVLRPASKSTPWEIELPESRVVFLGRGQSSGIAVQSVSRKHCELYWHGEPVVTVTCLSKRVVIVRALTKEAISVLKGARGEVRHTVAALAFPGDMRNQTRQRQRPTLTPA